MLTQVNDCLKESVCDTLKKPALELDGWDDDSLNTIYIAMNKNSREHRNNASTEFEKMIQDVISSSPTEHHLQQRLIFILSDLERLETKANRARLAEVASRLKGARYFISESYEKRLKKLNEK